jgi:hypothetical protein
VLALIPFVIAMLGGFGGALVYQRVVKSTWAQVQGAALAVPGTYRISVDAIGGATAAGIATALEGLGAVGSLYWPGDSYPTDWPTDDRAAGRCRVQTTLVPGMASTVGGYLWFPTSGRFRAWRLRGA